MHSESTNIIDTWFDSQQHFSPNLPSKYINKMQSIDLFTTHSLLNEGGTKNTAKIIRYST